jgi:hypothetical protein
MLKEHLPVVICHQVYEHICYSWRGQGLEALDCGIKSPFLGPWNVLTLFGIRRLVAKIKAIEKDGLLPF